MKIKKIVLDQQGAISLAVERYENWMEIDQIGFVENIVRKQSNE
ncbi:hypothetical protein [Acetobacterium paludosum]|nr:hypothetical protein [Acetobacterium paludosum]